MKVKNKSYIVSEENGGYNKVLNILNGDSSSIVGLSEELTENDLTYNKYAPIASTNV